MYKGETWHSHAVGDHVRRIDHAPILERHARINRATKSRNFSKTFRQFFSPLVRRYREKTSNTSALCIVGETLLYSVLMTLISGAIFLMSCIFAILAGLTAIVTFLITTAIKSGHKMQKFANNTRGR